MKKEKEREKKKEEEEEGEERKLTLWSQRWSNSISILVTILPFISITHRLQA